MKTLTLFRAYSRAMSRKSAAYHNRPREQWRESDITLGDDFWAVVWRRLDRKTRKLSYAIVKRLGGEDLGPICYKCGYPKASVIPRCDRPHGERRCKYCGRVVEWELGGTR